MNVEIWLLAPQGAIAEAEQHELHFDSSSLSVVRPFHVHNRRSIRTGVMIEGRPRMYQALFL